MATTFGRKWRPKRAPRAAKALFLMKNALAAALLVAAPLFSASPDPAGAEERLIRSGALLKGDPFRGAELTLGVGADEIAPGDDDADPDLNLLLGFRTAPLAHVWRIDLTGAAAVEVDLGGDVYAGVGLAAVLEITPWLRLDAGSLIGVYAENETDLGGPPQFRSHLGVAVALDERLWLGVEIAHKSNAGIRKDNPGVETINATVSHGF